MRCHELKAFRWWLMFERARRYEIRRNPDMEALWNMMAIPELNLHEGCIHSGDLRGRIHRLKWNYECRKIRRAKSTALKKAVERAC